MFRDKTFKDIVPDPVSMVKNVKKEAAAKKA